MSECDYYGDDDDLFMRFKLEKKGSNELIIIGINPSTARGRSRHCPRSVDDKTIKRVEAFSSKNWNLSKAEKQFDGFLMLNVCAQSVSDPDMLAVENDELLHEMNKKKITEYLNELVKHQRISVLLAYGDNIDKRKYLRENLKDIVTILKKYKVTFYRLGKLTANGNPRHPLPRTLSQLPITTPLERISQSDSEKMKLSLF